MITSEGQLTDAVRSCRFKIMIDIGDGGPGRGGDYTYDKRVAADLLFWLLPYTSFRRMNAASVIEA